VGMNELEIEEINERVGLQTNVVYFTIPGENFAGLVRSVTIKNSGHEATALEFLDGMPALIPYGGYTPSSANPFPTVDYVDAEIAAGATKAAWGKGGTGGFTVIVTSAPNAERETRATAIKLTAKERKERKNDDAGSLRSLRSFAVTIRS